MTSKLKCPVCKKPLEQVGTSRQYQCGTWGCDASFDMIGTEALWIALMQAKHDLEFFKEEQDMAITALIERTKELDKCQKDLEIATKALESISGIRENIEDYYGGVSIHYQQMVLHMDEIATNALETIGKHKE